MDLKEGLKYLVELGERAPHKIGELDYSDRNFHAIKPPRAQPLAFQRLQGFADFVLVKNDVRAPTQMVHVVSPFEVHFLSGLESYHRDREQYAIVSHDKQRAFKFGSWMAPEEFVIAAQTLMDDGEDRARLLEIAGNVGAEQVHTSTDDGVSQTVAVKAGVQLVKRKDIMNPFKLAAHRTFAEVKQPVSPFILRARQNGPDSPPMFALFPCDNESWQIDAIENIRAWLSLKLADTGIPILA